jgi:hypothetical protein
LVFNEGAAWFYSPGANTTSLSFKFCQGKTTYITSALPDASGPFKPVTVRVAVRENAGITITGDPSRVVEISDGRRAISTLPRAA